MMIVVNVNVIMFYVAGSKVLRLSLCCLYLDPGPVLMSLVEFDFIASVVLCCVVLCGIDWI
jgi:hypothetical protein